MCMVEGSSGATFRRTAPKDEGPTKKQLRILVVDDEPLLRKVVMRVMRRKGHECTEASDGKEALERFKTEHFDLVVSDFHMPEMDGLELIKGLKAINPDVKIVVGSGNFADNKRKMDANEAKLALLQAGATVLLDKPYDASQLENAVRSALN